MGEGELRVLEMEAFEVKLLVIVVGLGLLELHGDALNNVVDWFVSGV